MHCIWFLNENITATELCKCTLVFLFAKEWPGKGKNGIGANNMYFATSLGRYTQTTMDPFHIIRLSWTQAQNEKKQVGTDIY